MCAIICATRSPFNISASSIQVSVNFEKFDIKLLCTKRGGHVSVYGLYQRGSVCGDINSGVRSERTSWHDSHLICYNVTGHHGLSSSPVTLSSPSVTFVVLTHWPYLKIHIIRRLWYSPPGPGTLSCIHMYRPILCKMHGNPRMSGIRCCCNIPNILFVDSALLGILRVSFNLECMLFIVRRHAMVGCQEPG